MVKTLSGGGQADALHSHAGQSSGGGITVTAASSCYVAWGTKQCGQGFISMYEGKPVMANNVNMGYSAGMLCYDVNGLTVTTSTQSSFMLFTIGRVTGSQAWYMANPT